MPWPQMPPLQPFHSTAPLWPEATGTRKPPAGRTAHARHNRQRRAGKVPSKKRNQPLEPARQSDSVPAPRTIARVTAAGAGASMVVIGAELMKSGENPAVGVVVVGLTGLLAAALIAGLLLFLSHVFKKSSRRSVTNHGTQPKLCGTVFSARHWPVKDPGPSALHRRGEAGTPGPERLRTRRVCATQADGPGLIGRVPSDTVRAISGLCAWCS